MTAIQLYRYITENGIEWSNHDNNGEDDILIYPFIFQLEEFTKLLSHSSFDDGGLGCKIMDGYVAIWMKDICEYHGIELNEVFIEEEK